MSTLKPADITAYRTERLKLVRGTSVIKELELISRVIRLAQREWNILIPLNPASSEHVSRPKKTEDDERDRRLAKLHLMPSAEEVAYSLAKVSGKKRLAAHEARIANLAGQGVTLVFDPRIKTFLELPGPEEVALLRTCRDPAWFRPMPSDRVAMARQSETSIAGSAPVGVGLPASPPKGVGEAWRDFLVCRRAIAGSALQNPEACGFARQVALPRKRRALFLRGVFERGYRGQGREAAAASPAGSGDGIAAGPGAADPAGSARP